MITFYQYPEGDILYLSAHNSSAPRNVYINQKPVTLPYRGILSIGESIESVELKESNYVNYRYENDAGYVLSKKEYEDCLAQWQDKEGDWLSLSDEFAGRKFIQEWTLAFDREEAFKPVDFQVIELAVASNQWMTPQRHALGKRINFFQLDREGFAKSLAKELCEAEGLEWNKGYEWPDHSGLRYWQIEGKYVGTDNLKLKTAFYGIGTECEQEMARIEKEIRSIVNRWRNKNKKLHSADEIAKRVLNILSTLQEVRPYSKDASTLRHVKQRLRTLHDDILSQIEEE